MILLFIIYVYKCFSIFRDLGYYDKDSILHTQIVLCFMVHALGYFALFVGLEEKRTLIICLYVVQAVFLAVTMILYSSLYPKSSRLVLNNMCMLLSIGFVMLGRLNTDTCIKQMVLAAISVGISLVIPVIVRRMKVIQKWTYLYAAIGIGALLIVLVTGVVTGGAKLSFNMGPVAVQPSEFVKIIFVFFVASCFKEEPGFKRVVMVTAVAAAHVLILVASNDLGAAVIFFVVYLIMLFVATKQPLYLVAGFGGGALASVIAYKLFSHVRIRVEVWKDPFANWDYGFQVGQALFAIGTGSWFGMGLTEGLPSKIPVVVSDFIFAAIAEELGVKYNALNEYANDPRISDIYRQLKEGKQSDEIRFSREGGEENDRQRIDGKTGERSRTPEVYGETISTSSNEKAISNARNEERDGNTTRPAHSNSREQGLNFRLYHIRK